VSRSSASSRANPRIPPPRNEGLRATTPATDVRPARSPSCFHPAGADLRVERPGPVTGSRRRGGSRGVPIAPRDGGLHAPGVYAPGAPGWDGPVFGVPHDRASVLVVAATSPLPPTPRRSRRATVPTLRGRRSRSKPSTRRSRGPPHRPSSGLLGNGGGRGHRSRVGGRANLGRYAHGAGGVPLVGWRVSGYVDGRVGCSGVYRALYDFLFRSPAAPALSRRLR